MCRCRPCGGCGRQAQAERAKANANPCFAYRCCKRCSCNHGTQNRHCVLAATPSQAEGTAGQQVPSCRWARAGPAHATWCQTWGRTCSRQLKPIAKRRARTPLRPCGGRSPRSMRCLAVLIFDKSGFSSKPLSGSSLAMAMDGGPASVVFELRVTARGPRPCLVGLQAQLDDEGTRWQHARSHGIGGECQAPASPCAFCVGA